MSLLAFAFLKGFQMYHACQRDGVSLIEVDNDLDMLSSNELAAAIENAAQSERTIVVSLERCLFCDSTGLGVLINAKKRFGAKLLIVVPQGKRKIFDITGLTKFLAVTATLNEALAASSTVSAVESPYSAY